MADYQFEEDKILIQPYADAMGPFTFDLSEQLPSEVDIESVVVKSYLDGTETTSSLISGTPSVASNVVTVYFDYPGTDLHGVHVITFQYTLAGGAKDEADFYGVKVEEVQ